MYAPSFLELCFDKYREKIKNDDITLVPYPVFRRDLLNYLKKESDIKI